MLPPQTSPGVTSEVLARTEEIPEHALVLVILVPAGLDAETENNDSGTNQEKDVCQ